MNCSTLLFYSLIVCILYPSYGWITEIQDLEEMSIEQLDTEFTTGIPPPNPPTGECTRVLVERAASLRYPRLSYRERDLWRGDFINKTSCIDGEKYYAGYYKRDGVTYTLNEWYIGTISERFPDLRIPDMGLPGVVLDSRTTGLSDRGCLEGEDATAFGADRDPSSRYFVELGRIIGFDAINNTYFLLFKSWFMLSPTGFFSLYETIDIEPFYYSITVQSSGSFPTCIF